MIAAVVILCAVVAGLGYLVFRLTRKLFQFQDAFLKIDEFSAQIHAFTSQFEGKALLTDAPEAVHLHKLICAVREFFESYEIEQESKDG